MWPTGSNKTLEGVLSSCSTNDFAPQFYLCPPLAQQNNQIKERVVIQTNRMCDLERGTALGHCLLVRLNCYTVLTIWCLTLMPNRKSSLTRYPPLCLFSRHYNYCTCPAKHPDCMPMHGIAWAPIKNLQSQGLVSAFYTDWHTVKRKETKLEQG